MGERSTAREEVTHRPNVSLYHLTAVGGKVQGLLIRTRPCSEKSLVSWENIVLVSDLSQGFITRLYQAVIYCSWRKLMDGGIIGTNPFLGIIERE